MSKFLLIASVLLMPLAAGGQTGEWLGALKGENHGKKGHAYQGMDVWGNYAVSCQNQGIATIYRLDGDTFETVGQFHLGSFNKYNHANVVSFGVEKFSADDQFPLMYVSQCHKKLIDGHKDALFVERIMPDMQSSVLVQTIVYDDVNKDYGYALQWVVDRRHRMLYGYGNTVENSSPSNRHRVVKFRLPDLSDGELVILKAEDALENYTIEDVSGFSYNPIGQGLYIKGHKLYMPTGIGTEQHPSILYIWDLRRHRMQTVDLSEITTGELEDISLLKGCGRRVFLLQGQDGFFHVKL